jgi:hypothetical protein
MLPAHSVDALEAHAIEANQSRGAGNPQIAVAGLRQRLHARRRAILRSPGGVIELRDAQIGRQRERARHEQKHRRNGGQRMPEPACLGTRCHGSESGSGQAYARNHGTGRPQISQKG